MEENGYQGEKKGETIAIGGGEAKIDKNRTGRLVGAAPARRD